MRIFFDTSVLVAAMVASHPAHNLALPKLQQVQNGTETGVVAAHSLAELFAILTRLPVQPRISAKIAQQLISHNVLNTCEVVALVGTNYVDLLNHLASQGVAGGATYDALILHSALLANVDQILTLNEKDFRRVYPSLASKITTP
jgi:predicted nucleic acid-binding protein